MQFRIQKSHSGLHLSGTPRSVDPESAQVLSYMHSLDLKISFKTLTVGQKNIDGNIPVYGKVSNSQKNYSFIDEVETWGNIQYVVSLDIYGIQQVATKTIPLKEGDNVVYITVKLDSRRRQQRRQRKFYEAQKKRFV